MTQLAAARVLVSGRVQGVFYRASTASEARTLGLAGWVRNLPDGRVEALFEGPRPQVEKMLAWCAQGPPAARVEAASTQWLEPEGCEGFEVRH